MCVSVCMCVALDFLTEVKVQKQRIRSHVDECVVLYLVCWVVYTETTLARVINFCSFRGCWRLRIAHTIYFISLSAWRCSGVILSDHRCHFLTSLVFSMQSRANFGRSLRIYLCFAAYNKQTDKGIRTQADTHVACHQRYDNIRKFMRCRCVYL